MAGSRMTRATPVVCCLLALAQTVAADRGASKEGQPVANAAAAAGQLLACDFDIHYNQWIPTFEKHEYEHNDKSGKVHCLEACCRDPACSGVSLESDLDSQCYKYDKAPQNLNRGQDLTQFLLGDRTSEWSVFVKRVKPVQLPVGAQLPDLLRGPQGGVPHLSGALEQAIRTRPQRSRTLASEESALDKTLSRMAGSQFGECQWSVHYDTWLPTFDQGEYSHDEKFGGAHAHCLEQCCQDPTCAGLTMMSNEVHQCYKYSKAPAGLHGHGKRLGDGSWLLSKRPTWSVMIKATQPRSMAAPLPAVTASMSAAKAKDELTPEYIAAAAATMKADQLAAQQRQLRQPSGGSADASGVPPQPILPPGTAAVLDFRWIALSAVVIAIVARSMGDYGEAVAAKLGISRARLELPRVPGSLGGTKEKAPLMSAKADSFGGHGLRADGFGGIPL
eukprot:TRINITY_DN82287_c0_g1_i1.p1 TRINITY_DN82287_c0_g1~~TRINITY_DN82287_c0_g1_i1.p1  ORF type:complete len:447 (+),score=87.76 TRINITY_DN82287_c0_g1_i1:117-1457(+)